MWYRGRRRAVSFSRGSFSFLKLFLHYIRFVGCEAVKKTGSLKARRRAKLWRVRGDLGVGTASTPPHAGKNAWNPTVVDGLAAAYREDHPSWSARECRRRARERLELVTEWMGDVSGDESGLGPEAMRATD